MRERLAFLALATAALAVGGCSIAGTWKTVKVDPEGTGQDSPFRMVTFTDEGEYSATHQSGSELRTVIGKYTWEYKWDGMKLTVIPGEGERRTYAGHLNLFTKQLILSRRVNDRKVTTTLEKQADLP